MPPVLGSAAINWLTRVGGKGEVTLRGAGVRGTLAALGLAEGLVDPPMAELICPVEVAGTLGLVAVLGGLVATGTRAKVLAWPTWASVPLELPVLLAAWGTGNTLGAAPPETVELAAGDVMTLTP
jgi:hypothetical protein